MKTALAILVPLIFLGLFVASNWYVAFRLRVLLGWKRRLQRTQERLCLLRQQRRILHSLLRTLKR